MRTWVSLTMVALPRFLSRSTSHAHPYFAEYSLFISVFFVGYFLCEVPSNLVMVKIRPSIYLSIIVFSWGCIVSGMSQSKSLTGFLVGRFFLGCVEAGMFPGALFILTCWYTKKEVGKCDAPGLKIFPFFQSKLYLTIFSVSRQTILYLLHSWLCRSSSWRPDGWCDYQESGWHQRHVWLAMAALDRGPHHRLLCYVSILHHSRLPPQLSKIQRRRTAIGTHSNHVRQEHRCYPRQQHPYVKASLQGCYSRLENLDVSCPV